jgi:OmpA-OmpF porin, OOP family
MYKLLCVALLMGLGVALQSGCATKKYVRNRVAERVTPLENRTSELEETSRRNTQQISELKTGVDDVRTRADRAQSTADHASSSAEQANTRVSGVERNVEDLRANLDKYTLQGTSTVFFKPGSAVLTTEAMAQLDTFTARITDRGFVMEIVGYGDSDKETNYNQRLAQLRAEAVQRYLADKRNIPIMRMFSAGFGAARPMMQNASASSTTSSSGTAQTLPRRVEIHLLTNPLGERPPGKTGGSGGSSSGRNP